MHRVHISHWAVWIEPEMTAVAAHRVQAAGTSICPRFSVEDAAPFFAIPTITIRALIGAIPAVTGVALKTRKHRAAGHAVAAPGTQMIPPTLQTNVGRSGAVIMQKTVNKVKTIGNSAAVHGSGKTCRNACRWISGTHTVV